MQVLLRILDSDRQISTKAQVLMSKSTTPADKHKDAVVLPSSIRTRVSKL